MQLTDDRHDELYHACSPDGTKIAFDRGTGGNYDIYIMKADGGDSTPRRQS